MPQFIRLNGNIFNKINDFLVANLVALVHTSPNMPTNVLLLGNLGSLPFFALDAHALQLKKFIYHCSQEDGAHKIMVMRIIISKLHSSFLLLCAEHWW